MLWIRWGPPVKCLHVRLTSAALCAFVTLARCRSAGSRGRRRRGGAGAPVPGPRWRCGFPKLGCLFYTARSGLPCRPKLVTSTFVVVRQPATARAPRRPASTRALVRTPEAERLCAPSGTPLTAAGGVPLVTLRRGRGPAVPPRAPGAAPRPRGRGRTATPATDTETTELTTA